MSLKGWAILGAVLLSHRSNPEPWARERQPRGKIANPSPVGSAELSSPHPLSEPPFPHLPNKRERIRWFEDPYQLLKGRVDVCRSKHIPLGGSPGLEESPGLQPAHQPGEPGSGLRRWASTRWRAQPLTAQAGERNG